MKYALFIFMTACTARALDVPVAGDFATRDFASRDLTVVDLAMPDFAGVDLASDMARPHYCDGIYVVDIDAVLYFFDPTKLTFTEVGPLDCPEPQGSTFSMALSRQGTAYVLFQSGNLYSVDSTTGSCSTTSFKPDQSGFGTFGMGFASNSAGSTDETLFINNGELGSVDLTDFSVHPIAQLADGELAEMTGTGDGELWGFFSASVAHVAQIDKQTAALDSDISLPQIGDTTMDGFAFGFYGGSFYAFVYGTGTTNVWRIDTAKATATPIVTNSGLFVVGAGVSTCAPTH